MIPASQAADESPRVWPSYAIAAIVALILTAEGVVILSVRNDRPPAQKTCPGLELHRWYRPARAIGWDYQRLRWGENVHHGRLDLSPLYVTERCGEVAVCRGAVHGTILVPDCCAHLFVPATRATGDDAEDDPKKP